MTSEQFSDPGQAELRRRNAETTSSGARAMVILRPRECDELLAYIESLNAQLTRTVDVLAPVLYAWWSEEAYSAEWMSLLNQEEATDAMKRAWEMTREAWWHRRDHAAQLAWVRAALNEVSGDE